jgi:hypothetical protein
MTRSILIGAGAGLVSALLIAVVVKATPMALFLYLLAPLPVLIVALGWDHRAGLVATIVGGVALALGASPLRGIAYVAATALPAWWLAYLALLGRANAAGAMDWYPTGRLLAWIAGIAALSLTAVAMISSGSYDSFRARTQTLLETMVQVRPLPGEGGDAQADALERQIIDRFVPAVPALAAQGFALLMTLYLWAAGRIVQVSGRLPRPWPDLPSTVMPKTVVGLFVASLGLAFLPSYLSVLGAALSGALAFAFALQGLAAIHDRTRGRPGRGLMLMGLYLIVFLSQGLALVALTLLGLFDTVRGRRPRTA